MELLIVPIIGLTELYIINKQDKEKKSKKENFANTSLLPNIEIPNKMNGYEYYFS